MPCSGLSYRWLLTFWLALLLWAAVRPALAGQILFLDDRHSQYSLAPYLELLDSVDENLTITEVSSPMYAENYRPVKNDPLRLSFDREVSWLRFRLAAGPSQAADAPPSRDHGHWILRADYPYLREIDLYYPSDSGTDSTPVQSFIAKKAGLDRPFGQRDFSFRSFAFILPGDVNKPETYYLRLKVRANMPIPIFVLSEKEFYKYSVRDFYLFALSFGTIACMFFYNFFIYLSLRDRAFLFYVLYIGSAFITLILIYGLASALFDFGFYPYMKLLWAFTGILLIRAFSFVRTFLVTRVNSPFHDKLMFFFQIYGLILIGVGLTGARLIPYWMSIIAGAASPILGTWAGIVCWRKGFGAARYFLLAWGILGASYLMPSLEQFGLLPENYFIHHILPIGTALESIFLSFALADRIRSLRKEKEELKVRERRLHTLSITDALTGLYNKRFLDSKLESEIEHAHRLNQSLSLIILDVDNFKKFNDTHGHLSGDEVLIRLGEVIIQCIRDTDFPCRYGGEEFTVILPEVEAVMAKLIADRIRRRFADQIFHTPTASRAKCTVSLGLAQLQPGETAQQILHRADQALYRAKRQGKNQTVISGSELDADF